MSEWSNRVIDLPTMFTDKFSKEGNLGPCGDLTYKLEDNAIDGVEYTVVFLNEEKTQLIVESNDRADEGSYEFTLAVSLPQYPDS